MPLSDILVCLDSSGAGENRLRLAARLAREQGAHLIAVYELSDGDGPLFEPREAAGNGLRGAQRAEAAEERFRDTLRLNGITGDWHLIEQGDTAELAEICKTVDLVILGQFSRDARNGTRFRPNEVAMACGRPLLVEPYVGDFVTVGEHVLIAWDDTREATRALNDALPLLSAAKAVTVMTVIAREKEFDRVHFPLQRVVGHLGRHGVPARAEEAMRGDMAVSDLLLSRAADLGADMIVAGAFHHSQLREALVGGVSRDLLRHMTVPVLMSH
jgi:nucleotide-binding universal stress UspA family protein